MDYFKYITIDPNDHHERELLRELNDFSIVQFTQKSWFDREMKTVGKEIKYLDGRKNQEKYVKKRANVLKAMDITSVHEKTDDILEDDILDDLGEEDIDKMMKDDPTLFEDVAGSKQAEEKAKAAANILKRGRRKVEAKAAHSEIEEKEATVTKGETLFLSDEQRKTLTEEQIEQEEARLLKEANESFLQAVIDQNIEEAETLLQRGAQINYIGKKGLSALHYASTQEKTNALEWLLSKEGLDLNLVKRGERYNAYQHCLTSVIHGNGATLQSLDLLHLAGASLPLKSTVKKLENEFHDEWNKKMEAVQAQKRLDKARGLRKTKNKREKSSKTSKKKKKRQVGDK